MDKYPPNKEIKYNHGRFLMSSAFNRINKYRIKANMEKDSYIKFLGTAGARFVVAKQLRASGGIYLNLEGRKLILDPGPGSLGKCATSRPAIDVTTLDAIILSHAHLDHANDVNCLIDAMTGGGINRQGRLFAPRDCLEGESAVVLQYLRSFPEEIISLKENAQYQIGDLKFRTSVRHAHSVETYGFSFETQKGKVSFITDTKYFAELIDSYRDSKYLIINTVRAVPHESADVMHLSVPDVKIILQELKPGKAILTHFGMTMVKGKPWEMAKKLTDELGIEVMAAADGMTVEIE